MPNFVDWLNIEMGKNRISQAELAKRADLSQAIINKVIRGERMPGTEFCTKIARAFKYPPEFVFRIAGLLPKEPASDAMIAELDFLVRQLPTDQQNELIEIARAKGKRRRA